ncbi:hypothetical protein A9Q81_27575 [Gammaproteobacteria bacterium 42_54_T18]|nr:hypothetical protein A9Q81_27575 [Gammaproteobacteria bacterium 42_54_T18]
MKKLVVLLSMIVFVSGCASKVVDLNQPSKRSLFVIADDIYTTETRGLLNFKYVFGLRAGKYELVGEDSDGFYYHGQGDSVIVLSEERAEKYLSTGVITDYEERHREQFTFSGGVGGLWLPKNKEIDPKLYFLLNSKPEDSLEAGATVGLNASFNSPVSMAGGMVIGAATTAVIFSLTNGTIEMYTPTGELISEIQKIEFVDL